MDEFSYRKLQEAWLAGNAGSSWQEVLLVVSAMPLAIFLSCAFCKSQKFLPEFLWIVMPLFAAVADPFDDTRIIPGALLALSIIYIIFIEPIRLEEFKKIFNQVPDKRHTWLTNLRAGIYLLTAINILAVDFIFYPRRFAKTENFGFGLMDVGVGAFVLCNGLTYRRNTTSRVAKGALVLITLGFLRLLSTQTIDYHKRVTEYGLQWNFFFTLAFCNGAVHFLISILPVGPFWLAVATALGHQAALNSGLQDWVLSSAPRSNWIDANREGISSAMGYVAIYFASAAMGQWFMSARSRLVLLLRVGVVCAVAWAITLGWVDHDAVSRRLCNIGYISWIIGSASTLISQLILCEIFLVLCSKSWLSRTPLLMCALNSNGLFFFLLANLLTGFININFMTLTLSKEKGYVLMIVYNLIVCYIPYWLFLRDIKIKFW